LAHHPAPDFLADVYSLTRMRGSVVQSIDCGE
jgi:hypothetical protein